MLFVCVNASICQAGAGFSVDLQINKQVEQLSLSATYIPCICSQGFLAVCNACTAINTCTIHAFCSRQHCLSRHNKEDQQQQGMKKNSLDSKLPCITLEHVIPYCYSLFLSSKEVRLSCKPLISFLLQHHQTVLFHTTRTSSASPLSSFAQTQ